MPPVAVDGQRFLGARAAATDTFYPLPPRPRPPANRRTGPLPHRAEFFRALPGPTTSGSQPQSTLVQVGCSSTTTAPTTLIASRVSDAKTLSTVLSYGSSRRVRLLLRLLSFTITVQLYTPYRRRDTSVPYIRVYTVSARWLSTTTYAIVSNRLFK